MDDVIDFLNNKGINPEVYKFMKKTTVNARVEDGIYKCVVEYPESDSYETDCVVKPNKIDVTHINDDGDNITNEIRLDFRIDAELAVVEHNNNKVTVEAPVISTI